MSTRRLVALFVLFLLLPQTVTWGQDKTLVRVVVNFDQEEQALLPTGGRSLNVFISGTLALSGVTPDVATIYAPVQPGTQTVEFVIEGDRSPLATDELTFDSGQTYTLLKPGLTQPAIAIKDVPDSASIPDGSNLLTLVSLQPDVTQRFRISEDGSPLPQDRYIQNYNYYAQVVFAGDITVERVSESGEAASIIPVHYVPNTNALVVDTAEGLPSLVSYSTNLSVYDWLGAVSTMQNALFTFNQFMNSAVVGGFDGALRQCEDYMWLAWTDAAYGALAPELQTSLSGAMAGSVLNNSVLNPARTAAWTLSPTQTRGGIPLEFIKPVALHLAVSTPQPLASGAVSAGAVMTVATTGSGVQNVIQVLNAVPVTVELQAPVLLRVNYEYAGFDPPEFEGGE